MSLRQVLSYALAAGMSLNDCKGRTPGFVIDMFLYRRQYDFLLHGLKEK